MALEGTVAAGGEFAYQVQVTNLGPSDAQKVSLSDTLPSNTTLSRTKVWGRHLPWQVGQSDQRHHRTLGRRRRQQNHSFMPG